MIKTNKRAACCDKCGTRLEPGKGKLYLCCGSSSNCEQHWDEDGGWHVVCLDKETCQKRVEEERAREMAERERALKRRSALKDLRRLFEKGTSPDPTAGQVCLQGDEIPLDNGHTRIYGGGSWIVIEPPKEERRVWLVVNNGADGDDWSRSNVRTGGAGAIGCWLPWSEELESRCEEFLT